MHRSRKRFVAKMPKEGSVCREQQNTADVVYSGIKCSCTYQRNTSDATHLLPKTGEQHLIKLWERGGIRGAICTWKVNEESFSYSWSRVMSALVLPQRGQKFCCRQKVTDWSSPWDSKDSLLVISSWSSPAKGRAERVTLQAAVRFLHCYIWTGSKALFYRRLQRMVWPIWRQTYL